MTVLRPQAPGIPVPTPSATSAPYWEACADGVLTFQRCDACGAIPARATTVCASCSARSLSWVPSRGEGSLYSWTVVWRPADPTFTVPYAPAIVTLDEGWWLMSAVVGCTPDELLADMRLRVEFHPAGSGIVLPYVTPA